MPFNPGKYGDPVAKILALDGHGERLMPLSSGTCSMPAAPALLRAGVPFPPNARAPQAALSGLWLYFSCLDESHSLSQEIHTADGSFWHGIMHRQEPDPGNSGYWFRRVGNHPIFPQLAAAAATLAQSHPKAGFPTTAKWDPFAFIDFCEQARRRPGSESEQLALRIQLAEWQILFDYCAGPAA